MPELPEFHIFTARLYRKGFRFNFAAMHKALELREINTLEDFFEAIEWWYENVNKFSNYSTYGQEDQSYYIVKNIDQKNVAFFTSYYETIYKKRDVPRRNNHSNYTNLLATIVDPSLNLL